MAIHRGNLFESYEHNPNNKISENWEETKKILGNRIEYMFYEKTTGNNNIIDAMVGAQSTLGICIAQTLEKMISYERPILCTDLSDRSQFPVIFTYDSKGNIDSWKSKNECETKRVIIHEDERYIVLIRDIGSLVHIYVCKK